MQITNARRRLVYDPNGSSSQALGLTRKAKQLSWFLKPSGNVIRHVMANTGLVSHTPEVAARNVIGVSEERLIGIGQSKSKCCDSWDTMGNSITIF